MNPTPCTCGVAGSIHALRLVSDTAADRRREFGIHDGFKI